MQGLDAQSLSAVSDEILQAVDVAQNLDDLENVKGFNNPGNKNKINWPTTKGLEKSNPV